MLELQTIQHSNYQTKTVKHAQDYKCDYTAFPYFSTINFVVGVCVGITGNLFVSTYIYPFLRRSEFTALEKASREATRNLADFRLGLTELLGKLESKVGPGIEKVVQKAAFFVPEGLMEGSHLTPTSIYRDGSVAFLAEGKVLGFGHVIGTAGEIHVTVPEHVKQCADSMRGLGGTIPIGGLIFEHLTEDCLLASLSQRRFEELGCGYAKIAGYASGTLVSFSLAVVEGSQAIRSLGISGDGPFGMISYLGSTQPGCSGGGYYLGQKLIGMHLGEHVVDGRRLNVGYSLCYLRALIRAGGLWVYARLC